MPDNVHKALSRQRCLDHSSISSTRTTVFWSWATTLQHQCWDALSQVINLDLSPVLFSWWSWLDSSRHLYWPVLTAWLCPSAVPCPGLSDGSEICSVPTAALHCGDNTAQEVRGGWGQTTCTRLTYFRPEYRTYSILQMAKCSCVLGCGCSHLHSLDYEKKLIKHKTWSLKIMLA